MPALFSLVTSHLSHLGHALIPEIFLPSSSSTKRRHASETAWLDGLRGVAALLVVLQHEHAMVYMGHALCYHHPEQTSPASWPILRLGFSGGSFAVAIFFWISGYVVPRRLLKLLQEGRQADFTEALNSAVVRRHGRLLLPAIFSSLLYVLFFWITGIEPNWMGSFASSFWRELWLWLLDTLQVINYFTAYASHYNLVTWTIEAEMRGSMLLFGWLFVIHSLKAQRRIILTLGLSLGILFTTSYAYYPIFLIGMMCCEIDLLHDSGEKESVWVPWKRISDYLRKRPGARSAVLHSTLLVALLLASFPALKMYVNADVAISQCTSWPAILFRLTPWQYWQPTSINGLREFWFFWAAWLLAISIQNLRWAKGIFESSFPQYLGRHSFSLYLTHLLIGSTFSKALLLLLGWGQHGGPQAGWPFNQMPVVPRPWLTMIGPVGFQYGVVIDLALSLPVMFWVAEMGTKVFDTPSVRISAWMWERWKGMR